MSVFDRFDDIELPCPANINSPIGRLSYCHLNPDEYGRINDSTIPAPEAVNKIRAELSNLPYYQMVLAHQDKKHNKVEIIPEINNGINLDCDAIFVRRNAKKACRIGVFVGDCPTVVLLSPGWVGFVHSGTPEIFGGIWNSVINSWPADTRLTSAFIGPCIGGKYYEFGESDTPENLRDYLVQIDNKTAFDVWSCVRETIAKDFLFSYENVTSSNIDNYEEAEAGGIWASNRYWTNIQGVKSPRDLALLTIAPRADNIIHYHTESERVEGIAVTRCLDCHEPCLSGHHKHMWDQPLSSSMFDFRTKPDREYRCQKCDGILDPKGQQRPDGSYFE